MKKFYLSALGCLMAMGASAQKLDQVGTMQGEFWSLKSIPTEYAYNGKSSVYTVSEGEAEVEFTVYNKSFGVDRTIKVANPTSYSRLEAESREVVFTSVEMDPVECGDRRFAYLEFDNEELLEQYPFWWAMHKCTNTTFTDKYVYEWLEYIKGIYPDGYFHKDMLTIIDKEEYEGGTLFVTAKSEGFPIRGYYFINHCLYFYDYGEIKREEFTDRYFTFYNMQIAEFTQEYIEEYINIGQRIYFDNCNYGIGYYQVESITEDSEGNVVFQTDAHYYDQSSGKQYPELKFVWNKSANTLTSIGTKYAYTYTGEWQKSLIESDYDYEDASDWIWDATIMPFYVGKIMGEVYEEDGIIASQTLFNNDEKWEFLRPVFAEFADYDHYETREEDRDGDGEIDYKQTKYRDKLKAYEVVSENGNVLTTITVPEGEYYAPLFINWDGETFFGIAVEKKIEEDEDDYYEEYIAVYNIDKNASSVKKIAETPAMRVSPALANRNSTVNVTLDAETAKNGGELIITDSNGRAIARRRVEAGQTSVPVTTDRMSSGVYNITLTEKGQKVENARIIVK